MSRGQHLETNRRGKKRPGSLRNDLKRLREMAYHRFDGSRDLIRKFRRLRRTDHPDYERLNQLYNWLFVPLTLWPVNIEALFRTALDRIVAGKRLGKAMLLVIELLPPLPNEKTLRAVCDHEHSVQRGSYEPLIRARYKYHQIKSAPGHDPVFQDQWKAIIKQFDVAKYADRKGIVRRGFVGERSMRDGWTLHWSNRADRFHAVFDTFCQRWHLYGMRGNQPLLLKLTANLTPFGTMIFIPAYWSFDAKRDLNWQAITALHKARGVSKQGQKLGANQAAARVESARARAVWKEAASLKLKGQARISWMLKQLGWDSRTSERQLRRILAKSCDGS